MEIVVRYYAKMYADKQNIKFNERLNGLSDFMVKLNPEQLKEFKYDMSDEDIAAYHQAVKEAYGDDFVMSVDELKEKIQKRVEHYVKRIQRREKDREYKRKLYEEVKRMREKEQNPQQVSENEEVEEVPKTDEKKQEEVVEAPAVVEQVEEKAVKKKKLSAEFLDEMKNQVRSEKALYRKMKDRKIEVKESVEAEKTPVAQEVVQSTQPRFNWMTILMFGGIAAAVGIVYYFIKKSRENKVVTAESAPVQKTEIQQTPTQLNQQPSGVMSAADLLRMLKG